MRKLTPEGGSVYQLSADNPQVSTSRYGVENMERGSMGRCGYGDTMDDRF